MINKPNNLKEFAILIGLVEQYSPSGSERTAVEFLLNQAKSNGYTNSFIDEVGNAVCIMGNGPKQIVLLGHIDTVPGEITVRIEGDLLYGRGSVDAKAPLACFFDAVAQIGEVDGWQFIIIGAVEEERNSQGARFVSTQYRPAYTIIGEPNRWDRLGLGYKGSASANLSFSLNQTHSAHQSASTSEKVIEFWNDIRTYAVDYNTHKPKMFDQLLINIREMTSRDDGFTQSASLLINARLPLEIKPSAWYSKLADLSPGAEIEPHGFAIPAYVCGKNNPLVKAFLKGIRKMNGNPGFVYKSGTADLNIVAPIWQCPAIVYGPGDSSLDHTPDEHISLNEYRLSVATLTSSLKELIERDSAP